MVIPRSPFSPSAATESASLPIKPLGHPVTAAEWEDLLVKIAPEGYEKAHPGVLAKLAALLVQHPGDQKWEAGAVAYLAGSWPMDGKTARALWTRAVEALPDDQAVSDALVRCDLATLLPSARYKDIDALLQEQIARAPQDAHLLWIKAAVDFRDGRAEDAEALLQKAADLPPWKGMTGVAEYGDLQVREAMNGPVDPVEQLKAMAGLTLSDLGLYQGLAKDAAARAQTLINGMEYDRAQTLLLQTDRMGRAIEDGANLMITVYIGMAVEQQALDARENLATDMGDTGLLQDTQNRLAALQAKGDAVYKWRQAHVDPWGQADAILKNQSGITPMDWSNINLLKGTVPLTPDQQAQLRQLPGSYIYDNLGAQIAAISPAP